MRMIGEMNYNNIHILNIRTKIQYLHVVCCINLPAGPGNPDNPLSPFGPVKPTGPSRPCFPCNPGKPTILQEKNEDSKFIGFFSGMR